MKESTSSRAPARDLLDRFVTSEKVPLSLRSLGMRFLLTAHISPLTSHVSPLTSYLSPSILIVPAEPDVGPVPPLRRAVEPLVHPPHGVQSAGVAGVGVVDHAVLQRERAHARPLPGVGGHVDAGSGGHPIDGALALIRLPLPAGLP